MKRTIDRDDRVGYLDDSLVGKEGRLLRTFTFTSVRYHRMSEERGGEVRTRHLNVDDKVEIIGVINDGIMNAFVCRVRDNGGNYHGFVSPRCIARV